MAAYFNQKTKKWDANFSYRDFENNSKKKMKRGFETKEDALAWEQLLGSGVFSHPQSN